MDIERIGPEGRCFENDFVTTRPALKYNSIHKKKVKRTWNSHYKWTKVDNGRHKFVSIEAILAERGSDNFTL